MRFINLTRRTEIGANSYLVEIAGRKIVLDAGLHPRQLAEEARNTADRVTALLDEKRAGLSTIARQDLMREVRIGDLDKRIANLLASAKKGDPAVGVQRGHR